MERLLAEANVRRFRQMLQGGKLEARHRETVERLLAEEEARLAALPVANKPDHEDRPWQIEQMKRVAERYRSRAASATTEHERESCLRIAGYMEKAVQALASRDNS